MFNTTERRAWLDGLQAGHRVVLVAGGFRHDLAVATVTKRTNQHGGTIVVADRQFCARTGWERGPGFYTYTIEPLTPEMEIEIRKQRLVYRLSGIKNWDDLPIETLEAVWAALKPTESEKEGV